MRLLAKTTLCLAVLFVGTATAEDDRVVQVEEHWEMKVREPDPVSVAPQVTNAFAPNCTCHDTGFYAAFSLNHRVDEAGDDFAAGGLQLQMWDGDTLLGQKSSERHNVLATPGEVISWKQILNLKEDGTLSVAIRDGRSETWGQFGNSLTLSVSTTLHCLSSYNPEDSINNSGAVFADNQVAHRILKKVVATYKSGAVKVVYVHSGD